MKKFLLTTSVCALAACQTTSSFSLQEQLLGKTFVLQSVNGVSLQEVLGNQFMPQNAPSLIFQPNSTIAGVAGCNRIFGPFDITNGVLKLKNGGATKMMCPPNLDKLEMQTLNLLNNGGEINYQVNQLVIKNDLIKLIYKQTEK